MSESRTVRVIVADPRRRPLDAAISILSDQFDVLASATSAHAAIDVALELAADVVVLAAPARVSDVFEAVRRITVAGSSARIVVVSNDVRDGAVLAAMERGVAAYV